MHDTIIKGGTIVDGTGAPKFNGDVAFTDGRITGVGSNLGAARRTIEADGLLVTPAWVDVHTHYDGQATWDAQLAPSLWHGVATVVMGNCGVGFAPAKPDRHEWLIGLMEGVEDIPGASLAAGIPWGWETFPEYLEVLEQMPRTLDIGTQLTHGALRGYVMGERGAKNEVATADDIAQMAGLAREAILAGALGFSTSRTPIHTAVDGQPVPGTFASEIELLTIARAIKQTGRGLLEWVPAGVGGEDLKGLPSEIELMHRIGKASGCPITFLMAQHNADPEQWREELRLSETAAADGARIIPQVFGRPVCTLFSIQGDNPFQYFPSFQPIKNLPLAEKLTTLRNLDFRRKLLAEDDPNTAGMSLLYKMDILWERTYPMGYPLSYTPMEGNSIAAIARREGRSPREVAYELMLENDGRAFLMYAAAGYAQGNEKALFAMLNHPLTALGGSDAGAHVRVICDASMPTYMLTHWVRGHAEGTPYHLPLEMVVRKLSRDGARLFGMADRGTLEPGMKADINLIDFDRLDLNHPEVINDLPAGMPRLMQTAKGYVATFVSGEAVQEEGRDTGARPGKIVRGGAQQPL